MKSDELQAPKHHKKCGGHFPSGAAKIINYDPETKRRRKNKKIESEQPIEETSRRNGAFRDRVSLFHTFSHFVCCCFVFLSLSLSLYSRFIIISRTASLVWIRHDRPSHSLFRHLFRDESRRGRLEPPNPLAPDNQENSVDF